MRELKLWEIQVSLPGLGVISKYIVAAENQDEAKLVVATHYRKKNYAGRPGYDVFLFANSVQELTEPVCIWYDAGF